jgi:hypothetical protein
MHTNRWTLFYLSLAFVFAIPLLLIVSSPLLHAAGFKGLASAGDNMGSSTDGQKGAMGSTAASGAAGAAAAGSSSGKGRGKGSGDDTSPMTDIPKTPKTSSDDNDPKNPFDKGSRGTGKQPGDYDPNKTGSSTTGTGTGTGSSGDDSGFLPGWLTDILGKL